MDTMTEEEAKKRWCPFARYSAGSNDNASNRWQRQDGDNDLNPPTCRCIGSGCMAWREAYNDRGFCGLAGTS